MNELLEKKKGLLDEVLKITREADAFPKDESDDELNRACEVFTALYSRREEIFGKIRALDEKIGALGGEVAERSEIKEVAKKILALDKELASVGERLKSFLGKNVKELNAAKKARKYSEEAYQPDSEAW